MNGFLLVDKPAGPTSHDAVDTVRKAARMRRVGHTGTLDPAATGLLVLCLGQATRLSQFLMGTDKTYEGVMRLGIVTDSHDLDGAVVEERFVPSLSEDDVQNAFNAFQGEILQTPPMVSAVKVGGQPLYKRARKGEAVERSPRPVSVYEFTVLDFNGMDAAFRLRCSSGTYARTLCFDVGEALGCGGTLASLRRTAVGSYSVGDATPLDDFRSPEDVESRLLAPGDGLPLPEVVLTDGGRELMRHGSAFGREAMAGECPVESGWVQVKSSAGELLAVAEVEQRGGLVHVQPRRVLCGG